MDSDRGGVIDASGDLVFGADADAETRADEQRRAETRANLGFGGFQPTVDRRIYQGRGNPSKARKTQRFAGPRTKSGRWGSGRLSERQEEMRAKFRNKAWREENLYGRRESLADFLGNKAKASSMRYSTPKGVIKYHVGSAAKGLLRSKASRKKYWRYFDAVIPTGARSITNLDAAKVLRLVEMAKRAKRGVSHSSSIKRENPF